MGDYRLELADCHEFIKTLPDASIDAVIQDPPYHTTQLAFDALEVRWSELWPEIYRVCKPSAVQVMFSAQPFTTDLINSNRKRFMYEDVWEKSRPSNVYNAAYMPLRYHESFVVFGAGIKISTFNPQKTSGHKRVKASSSGTNQSKHFGTRQRTPYDSTDRYPSSVHFYPNGENRWDADAHPTQKPLELLTYLVKTYTNPGDTVLDLFSGSGTTGHACLLTGRRFIGCELDETYYRTAQKRLEAAAAQESLFTPT